MAVHLDDHITTRESRIVRRASRLNIADNRAMDIAGQLQLLAQLRSHIGDADSPARFAMLFTGLGADLATTASHLFQRDWKIHALAIALHTQSDFVSRIMLPNEHLKLSCIAHC